MSCLIFTEKGDEALPVREDLLGPLRMMQVCAVTPRFCCRDVYLRWSWSW